MAGGEKKRLQAEHEYLDASFLHPPRREIPEWAPGNEEHLSCCISTHNLFYSDKSESIMTFSADHCSSNKEAIFYNVSLRTKVIRLLYFHPNHCHYMSNTKIQRYDTCLCTNKEVGTYCFTHNILKMTLPPNK